MNSFSVVDDRKGNYSINFTPEMAGSHEIVILVDNTVVKYVIYSILNLFIYLFISIFFYLFIYLGKRR